MQEVLALSQMFGVMLKCNVCKDELFTEIGQTIRLCRCVGDAVDSRLTWFGVVNVSNES